MSMELKTELEFEKYCIAGWSPKLSRPSHHRGSIEERDAKGEPFYRSYALNSLDKDFTEISFGNYKSTSSKSMLSGPSDLSNNEELKRGSIYQSSKSIRKMKKMGAIEGKKNIELSRSSDTSFSFRVVDSLPQLNEDIPLVQQKRSSMMSGNPNTTSVNNPCMESCSQDFLDLSFRIPPSCNNTVGGAPSDHFFELSLDSENRGDHSVGTIKSGSMEDLNFGPLNDGNDLRKRDTIRTLQKSSSEKVRMPNSPFRSESDHSRSNPKARFSSIRRMLDPIMKSKSQRSLLIPVAEPGDATGSRWASIRRNKKTLCKSLLNDFSNTVQNTESGVQFVEKDCHSLDVASSPAHLHGLLKLEYKHGVPLFEFFVKDLVDTLAAKTWKADNAFNWVYTFHSTSTRRKSNSNGWGVKEQHKETAMVGQMQISCYLCTEMSSNGAFDNSMVTEFVLYDIARAKKCAVAQESSQIQSFPESIIPPKGTSGEGLVSRRSFELNTTSVEKCKPQLRHASGNDNLEASTPYPWAPTDLHPNHEIAAIVVQVPFENRESFKEKIGAKISNKLHSHSFDFSTVERDESIPGSVRPTNVKVVIPSGAHGLPSDVEGGGPSPLLDRWRLGGGCDCGGWDMACPLIVFGNPHGQAMGDHLLMENKQPLELFVQGAKEKMPALTMKVIDEGQYAVDFHAQLSTLQAFSICVATLHSAEASTAIGQEQNGQLLQCTSLKTLFEEKVKFLIEAVADEENIKVTKRMEGVPPPFVVNPPFSPIARV